MDNEMNMKELKDRELRAVNGGLEKWLNRGSVKVMQEQAFIAIYANKDVTDLKIINYFDLNQVLASRDALKAGQIWYAPVKKEPNSKYLLQLNYIPINGEENTFLLPIED